MIGLNFGDLIVIKKENSVKGRGRWLCSCSCGNTSIVETSKLRNGHTKSCGCKKAIQFKHGYSDKERLYIIWKGIKRRTTNKKNKSYAGRGIKLCEEWCEYVTFREWALSSGYSDNLTIERINVNGNYEPSNCKWIPFILQAHNKQNTIYIKHNNLNYTLTEFSKTFNIPLNIVTSRYEHKFTADEIIHGRKKCKYIVEINNEIKSLREWCILYNFTYNVALNNYKKGLKGKEIFKLKDTTKAKKYVYLNKILTLSQWEKELNIKRGVLRHRIDKQGMSFEDGIKKESNKNKITLLYNNKEYLIKELSLLLNIPYNIIYSVTILNKKTNNLFFNKLKNIKKL